VLQYQEVMLDILLLAQPGLATAFVHRTLGQLAEDTAEAGRLRATMEASFRFGSHVAAAEELHVHEHTVRNRLARVEELLGHSLRDNRTEVEVALRLKRSLGEGPAASAP
jgi:DNA-binding PucR family transcriptional regulator